MLLAAVLLLSSCVTAPKEKTLAVVDNIALVEDSSTTIEDTPILIENASVPIEVNSFLEGDSGKETVEMLFGGDVTLTWGYLELVPDPYRDIKWPFRRLEGFFSEMDVVMVNCENAITDKDTPTEKQFNFRMDPALVHAFSESGIDIVNLANNHVFDYGPEGLADTLAALDKAGVRHVGAGMNLREARAPVIMDIKGRKVAFLGYGNYSAAGPDKPGVAYRFKSHVRKDIEEVKRDGADVVVVNFHWGIELEPEPQDSDRELAYLAIDSGADVVIGHHPHVLQPVEIYKGKVIAFSLGNFVFGGNSKRPRDSMLLQVSVANNNDVSYRIVNIRIDPQETRYQPYITDIVAGK
jgi:poly-gamma-glutamate synthesis protein (capsule biosynthesis protein)